MGKYTEELLEKIGNLEKISNPNEFEKVHRDLLECQNKVQNIIEEFRLKAENAKTDKEIFKLKKECELLIDFEQVQEAMEKIKKLTK